MHMKHHFYVLIVGLTVLLLSSCENHRTYSSGNYLYYYYLANKTSSPVSITNASQYWQLIADDTVNIAWDEKEEKVTDIPFDEAVYQLHRPSLEDGYVGTLGFEGDVLLTYLGKRYRVDATQPNSFLLRANYKGIQSPKSAFIYEYYFTIDEDYIATLPLHD